MQLFIISQPIDTTAISIDDEGIVHQMSRVLRMNVGDQCSLQWENDTMTTRGLYEISGLSKKSVQLFSLSESEYKKKPMYSILAVALPNKRSKAELIIQKVSEIGVAKIIWFPAQRSQYRTIPIHKLERMRDISKEATEQSWGWSAMSIDYAESIESICEQCVGVEYEVCDILPHEYVLPQKERSPALERMVFVGPEGGRGPLDYEILDKRSYGIMDLGKTVLRMETAAIIAGWRIINDQIHFGK